MLVFVEKKRERRKWWIEWIIRSRINHYLHNDTAGFYHSSFSLSLLIFFLQFSFLFTLTRLIEPEASDQTSWCTSTSPRLVRWSLAFDPSSSSPPSSSSSFYLTFCTLDKWRVLKMTTRVTHSYTLSHDYCASLKWARFHWSSSFRSKRQWKWMRTIIFYPSFALSIDCQRWRNFLSLLPLL